MTPDNSQHDGRNLSAQLSGSNSKAGGHETPNPCAGSPSSIKKYSSLSHGVRTKREAPSRRNCEDSIRAIVTELHDEAAAPAVQEAAPRAADRLKRWRLSPEEALALFRIENDYRSKVAELLKTATPEAVLGLKWRTIEAALGPEASDIDSASFAAAAELLEREEARRARVAALPCGYSCGELLATDFPPPQWIVPELLVSGLTILAGAPKLGKSWLALALGSAVGAGGAVLGRYRVERRRAVYLALEDNPRRLRARLEKIGASPASRLELFTSWRSGAEGVADLDAYLEEHPDTMLAIIDTFAKFRGAPISDDRYAADYAATAAIKETADRHECALLLVHHTRKQVAEDVMYSVSGTNGLNGAADATWILTRARGEADAKLFITGRDVEEQELALTFDRDLCTWRALGDAAEYAMSKERREILELLRGQKMKPKPIADALGKNPSTTRVILSKMLREGSLSEDAEGFYSAPGGVSTINTINSVNREETPPASTFTPLTLFTPSEHSDLGNFVQVATGGQ